MVRVTALAACVAACLVAGGASGQNATESERVSLRARVGVSRGVEMLDAVDVETRIRGVERLAADGSDEAIDALSDAMAPGTTLRADAQTRLAAVRALAPHAGKEAARRVLVSVLTSVRSGAPETTLDALVRATAAMALARAGTQRALTPLVAAVIGRGDTGELARQAILAHPPKSLGALGKGFEDLSPAVLALLGDLGDPRAIGLLRKQLRRQPPIRHAAGIALAKLGDGSVGPLARRWLGKKDDLPAVLAAAEVLMLLDAPEAPQAIARLLGGAKTRAAGLRLAEASLSPSLVPTLGAVIGADVTDAERARAVRIVAKIGGDDAARLLLGLLSKPELAGDAAFGLARAPGEVARAGLERALASAEAGPARRLVLRAALLRRVVRAEGIAGLADAVTAALASDDAADRAVGSFGAVVLDMHAPEVLAADERVEVAAGAARGALWLGPEALSRLGPALAEAAADGPPSARTVALGVALLEPATLSLPTSRLASWAEGGGALAPLAAMQLAQRDSAVFRGRLMQLLSGTDPVVRLHVALGLSDSPEPDAVAMLCDAYRFEADAQVRRAIVRALSARHEKLRLRTLELARDLDPDGGVRALAASALGGRDLRAPLPPRGDEAVWIALRANAASERAHIAARTGYLMRADGLALPLASDPDGVVIVAGMAPSDALSLRLR